MSRKNQAIKRELVLDPVYESKLITQLVNSIMVSGKKSLARKIVYKALDIVKEKANDEPLKVFEKAIENIKPQLEVKTRRIGGANYQVPIEVSEARKTTLAIRWLVSYARIRNGRTMEDKLALEIFDAAQGNGSAVKKRDEIHRAAEANKAFAHYKW
ncbi:30S ribosomal protein S7 [Spiroplasma platyhelix]|uniref:Small ribosomal subunit protein uS7 n=1 Tax=Spiroplasma platyhelix PALS-1 TaxID=1276218 RepID=A0A846TWR2_9MOLU|nr:30S ribosomal protein S7 [Spiroplasma platyhelix]MBE4704111.1 30S ribosomal protein S7 [Spiroplasma platyhelix PALS-1]NKE38481.1 30S ribosomal protein S7 [Spiroplasma platyhelix PALS-1]UJB29369.1 30S ribosomal protein S7 [Spiroplasma platyhelix PALS-1]